MNKTKLEDLSVGEELGVGHEALTSFALDYQFLGIAKNEEEMVTIGKKLLDLSTRNIVSSIPVFVLRRIDPEKKIYELVDGAKALYYKTVK